MSPDSHQTLAEVITKSMHKEGYKPPPPPQLHEKCPRCDSPNTKFCYYNNYNLSQPRHYCKACRRYWTKGGALRNVPIGGGCRKTRKMKQISNSNNHNSSYERNAMECNGERLNFSLGFLNPGMDSQLDSNSMFPISSFSNYNTIMSSYDSNHSTYTSQLTSGHHQSSDAVATMTTGFDGTHETKSISDINSSMTVHTNLASSIESLSFINQELHWKLQQQRLAALFSENRSENPSTQTEEPSIIRTGANGGGRNNIMIKEFFDTYYPANG